VFVHVFFHVFPLSKKLSSKGKSKSLRASWMLLTCTWQELATSITGRLVPGHPGHPGHPKQWDAVKDLPKWDRCWDWCWDGLELKYTWNILKRGFYFGSWWFWCSSKGAVSWYVRNQWTPRMAGNFWMIVLDPTTPTTPVLTSPMCFHHFRAGRPWKFLPSSNTAGKPPV